MSLERSGLDEIGPWSEIKLEIIRKYAHAYSKILHGKPSIRGYAYIDAFAGRGTHRSKQTGLLVPGSPQIALETDPPFSEYHFVDLDDIKVEELRQLAQGRSNVTVHGGDGNKILIEKVFPRCRFKDRRRGLCLLDPYGLDVHWRVLAAAGGMGTIEVFYSFMIGSDVNRNVLWRNPDKVPEEQRKRMDAAWGDRSWRNIAYKKSSGLFDEIEEKAPNEVIAAAFRDRLERVGFAYVPKPLPMKNSRGAVLYYLYFASPNSRGGQIAAKIVNEIFGKYR